MGRHTVAGILLLAASGPPAVAQNMVHSSDPGGAEQVQRIERALASVPEENTLSCSVQGQPPLLNFAFRYYAGWVASLPMRQFREDAFELRLVFRVTPETGGGTYYFWETFNLPPGARPKGLLGRLSGGYLVGEGSYRVDWLLLDDAGRSCRRQWGFKLRIKKNQRAAADFIEPGVIEPLLIGWEGSANGPERPYRIAVILHAAPVHPRSIRMTSPDQSFLTTMLAALLEDTPFRETMVYALNLEQQSVIFESPKLDAESFGGLLSAMESLSLGTIGHEEYFNPDGSTQVLADVVNRELASPNPPDAIVFIGPNNRTTMKFPQDRLEAINGQKPRFFYLHLDFFSRRHPWPDIIERLTKGQNGKVFSIRHPDQLIQALEKMEEMLQGAGVGSA
jgi:hypothetical protein